jgi:ATP phosphoribosyltransferase
VKLRHSFLVSVFRRITNNWIKQNKLNAKVVHAFGATESFPPDDADMILDNTSTGATLKVGRCPVMIDLESPPSAVY